VNYDHIIRRVPKNEGEESLTLDDINLICKDFMKKRDCIESIVDRERGGWHKKIVAKSELYQFTILYFT
jgi:hypothetical protein